MKIPHLLALCASLLCFNLTKAQEKVYIIPVVFHVLHHGGAENISDEQILSAVKTLNEDYRKLNADTAQIVDWFKPLAADMKIEFRLAQIDPNGNCTTGIDRIFTVKSINATLDSKINQWPREKYLYIWTVRSIDQQSTMLEAGAPGTGSKTDGIVVLSSYVGTTGTAGPATGNARSLTHGLGHWLDVHHVFGQGIDPNNFCGDDGIADTPPTTVLQNCNNLLHPNCSVDTINDAVFNLNSVTSSSGLSDPGVPPGVLSRLAITPLHASVVGQNSLQDSAFVFADWPIGAPDGASNFAQFTGDIDPSKNYHLAVEPLGGNSMILRSVKMRVARSADGPRMMALKIFTGGFYVDILLISPPPGVALFDDTLYFTQDVTGDFDLNFRITSDLVDIDQKVDFTIYPFNAESSAGWFKIDNVSFNGSAGLIENLNNFMTFYFCGKMFTNGQKQKARSTLEGSEITRNNLWKDQNLSATGVNNPNPCTPTADFYSDKLMTCPNFPVNFTSNTSQALVDSLYWEFEGGSPATSSSRTPSVRFADAGKHSVTLKAINAMGSAELVKTDYITIQSDADVAFSSNYSQAFEIPSIIDTSWKVADVEMNGNTWEYAVGNGVSGSNCVRVNAFDSESNNTDELLSPVFDMSGYSTARLNFKYAGATRAGVPAVEQLVVSFANSCGLNYIQRVSLDPANNLTQSTAFIPNASSKWTEHSLPISVNFLKSYFRIKFAYISSDKSNNVYLDDINIIGSVGVSEFAPEIGLNLYPNPAKDKLDVEFEVNYPSTINIELLNVLGQSVYNFSTTEKVSGEQHFVVPAPEVMGTYVLRMRVGGDVYVRRVVFSL